jgi:hypothetical protein
LYVVSDLSRVRVLFCYRSFAGFPGISHVGLGISSNNNMKVLRQNGIDALVKPIALEKDLRVPLDSDQGITHMVSSAPWISTPALAFLADNFPEVVFTVNCHSNVGFLQTDPGAIRLIRQEIDLEQWKHNFHVSGNSAPYCEFINEVYEAPCTYLPNMYYIDDTTPRSARPSWAANGGVLRIGLFGAPRAQKNVACGAAGAIMAAKSLGAKLELYVNSGRNDGGEALRILNSVRAMTENMPTVELKYAPWAAWPEFRRFVATMDACVQVSYTESFNIVTADAASRQIPSVVSDAIGWAPDEWKAAVDSPQDIARHLVGVILDPAAGRRGMEALMQHNADALEAWKRYLLENEFGVAQRKWSAIGHPKAGSRHLSKPSGGRVRAA